MNRAATLLRDAGHQVDAVATTGPRTGAAIAKRCIAEGADVLLVAGGDGTLNEVINGAVHSDVPVGILPGGTANVLAMELAIGSRLDKAARLVSDCIAQRISLGLLRCAGEERRAVNRGSELASATA